jgi:ATP-dependent exoDNAse (exonuclease V) beta subunit
MRWSAAAEALFRLDRATAVSAGAGSGKTTALVELCLRLLSGAATGSPLEPGSIVAITFTERAAEELSARLRGAVAARAREAAGADARAWRERLHALERMAVGTIHGWCGTLLREYAVEAGVDPEFEVLDEERSDRLRLEAARAEVLAAADAGRAGARVLCAGYGAGGRRGGLAEVVAGLLRERATLGLAGPVVPAPADPGAAVAARDSLLSAARDLAGRRAEATTASGRKALAALAERLAALPVADGTGEPSLASAARIAGLAALVGSWRLGKGDREALRSGRARLVAAGEQVLPAAAEVLAGPQSAELCALVAGAEVRYAAAKRQARALDFDDLLAAARDLLRTDRDLRRELRARVRALLVDEYQDVNGLQQEIFDLLAGPGPAEEGAPAAGLLVAVGDARQSIYRFRGADVAVFNGLVERLGRSPSGRVLHLAENHRSTPAVLALVNAVFERASPAAGAARPYEVPFGEADRLVPIRAGGVAPACEILVDGESGLSAERRAREARAVAVRIRALASGAAGVTVPDRDAGSPRPPRHGEMALLFRRLTQVADYERALREAGIPYRLARGGGFYQAAEVRDLGELLASLFEPGDAVALAALLRSPYCGVSDGTLLLASQLGLGTFWRREPGEVVAALRVAWSGPPSPPPGPAEADALESELSRLARFLVEWRALRALRDRLSPPDLLLRAVERLDVDAALLAGPDGERRLGNLRKAVELARRHARAGGTALDLAARLRSLAERPPREPEADLPAEDAVALLSIHQAKGLEWPVVFVPDLGARTRNDGRRAFVAAGGRVCASFFDLPSESFHPTQGALRARDEARRAAEAESRRLLYVALTRARDYLVLSGGGRRDPEGSWSGLVDAVGADLVRRVPAAEAATFAVARPAPPAAPPLDAPGAPIRPPRLAPPAPLPAVQVAVTDLAEYARCPRRHFYSRHLGLPEPAAAVGAPGDDPARATARGTLAHAMLSELDLGAPPLERRAQLAASATRRGYDPRSPAVRRVLGDVHRFLESRAGSRLAALSRSGALRREVPFLLRLEGDGTTPACYLSGTIDALAEDANGVALVDFKYAMARPGSAGRYRTQLLAYALAASRAFPGRPLRSGLQFLRGSCAAVDLTPAPGELERFAGRAPRLALGAFRGEGEGRSPAELSRDEGRCRSEGCGYATRCFGPGVQPRAGATPQRPRVL